MSSVVYSLVQREQLAAAWFPAWEGADLSQICTFILTSIKQLLHPGAHSDEYKRSVAECFKVWSVNYFRMIPDADVKVRSRVLETNFSPSKNFYLFSLRQLMVILYESHSIDADKINFEVQALKHEEEKEDRDKRGDVTDNIPSGALYPSMLSLPLAFPVH